MIVNDFDKFFVQKGIIKDKIVEDAILDIRPKNVLFYRDNRLIIVINDDVGYLCTWDNDRTIVIYKYKEECKVKFYVDTNLIKTIYLETHPTLTTFTLLMDYYEVENIVVYHNLYNKKLKLFSF